MGQGFGYFGCTLDQLQLTLGVSVGRNTSDTSWSDVQIPYTIVPGKGKQVLRAWLLLTSAVCHVQKDYREHMASIQAEASSAHQPTSSSDTNGHSAHASDHAQAQRVSKGVAPGSFVDLLVKGRNRATGQRFSDAVLGQQVGNLCPIIR